MLDDDSLKVKIRSLLWQHGRMRAGTIADKLPPKDSCIQDVERVCLEMTKKGELRASKLGVWLPSSAPEWGKR